MEWSAYGSFLAFAVVLVLLPGRDFAVVSKNALAGGRRRGAWTAVGVACSNAVQSRLLQRRSGERCQPVFEAIKWAGIAYLGYLAAHALRSAVRGRYAPLRPSSRQVVPSARARSSAARPIFRIYQDLMTYACFPRAGIKMDPASC